MECASATCLCMDHKASVSSLDNGPPCERGKMFREKELPTEIKDGGDGALCKNVEAFK